DALFAYIRANNIDCANLEQLKKAAQVVRERFPFVPGTLRGKILRVDGEQPAVPEAFQQRLTLEVKTAAGAALLSWSTPAPAVYGKRVEIDYAGATSEDQATLDAYGGVFETPPYLVDLKPVVRRDGSPGERRGQRRRHRGLGDDGGADRSADDCDARDERGRAPHPGGRLRRGPPAGARRTPGRPDRGEGGRQRFGGRGRD